MVSGLILGNDQNGPSQSGDNFRICPRFLSVAQVRGRVSPKCNTTAVPERAVGILLIIVASLPLQAQAVVAERLEMSDIRVSEVQS